MPASTSSPSTSYRCYCKRYQNPSYTCTYAQLVYMSLFQDLHLKRWFVSFDWRITLHRERCRMLIIQEDCKLIQVMSFVHMCLSRAKWQAHVSQILAINSLVVEKCRWFLSCIRAISGNNRCQLKQPLPANLRLKDGWGTDSHWLRSQGGILLTLCFIRIT